MVKVNNKFSFNRYSCGWELHETKKGTSRQGDNIDVTDIFFYSTVEGVIRGIMDRSGGDTTDLKSFLVELRNMKKEIIDSINIAGITEVCKIEARQRNMDSSRELDEPDDDDDEDDEDEVIKTPQRRTLA